jgi:hypothetical protein
MRSTQAENNNAFLLTLSHEARSSDISTPKEVRTIPTVSPKKLEPAYALKPGLIAIGKCDLGGPVGIDLDKLVDGRLLIQGTSGAGKSWTLRRLIEQTHSVIQQIVIDPEGEFRSIADQFQHTLIDASRLEPAALAAAARRIRKHRINVIVDLSDVDRETQMIAVQSFVQGIIDAPREHWTPALVIIDEAHLFAPFGAQSSLAASSVRKAAIGTITDLMSRGRKRGLCGVLATQRLARLAKSVASEVHNFLIGRNTLDIDIRRAAETIGWDSRRAFDRLPMLDPGDFVGVGPCFTISPAVLHVGAVKTAHKGATPFNSAPAALDPEQAARLLDLDSLIAESETSSLLLDEARLPEGARAVRNFIRAPLFPLTAQIWDALQSLQPEGAALTQLADHFQKSPDDIAAALALLDQYGMLEFSNEGEDRAVRLSRKAVQ